MMMIIIIIIIMAELHACEACLSIQENLVMTSAYDLPFVQTPGGGGKGVRSQPAWGGVSYS